MILVRLMGGLGNQMFQYAASKAIAVRNSTEVKIDTTLLDENRKNPHDVVTHRKLDLDLFCLKLIPASKKEIEYFNGTVYRNILGKLINKLLFLFRRKNLIIEKTRSFDPRILKLNDHKCLVGAWQSELYFKDIASDLKKEFGFKDHISETSANLALEIQSCNSICLNVRRTDYVTSPIYSKRIGALDLNYYHNAISIVEDKIPDGKIFVFSDDLDWCRANIRSNLPVIFVGHEHAGEKFGNYLQLMSFCRHFIISNSTFSWWGAWLGEKNGTVVIAPETWARNPASDPRDIVPDRWLKLTSTFEEIQ